MGQYLIPNAASSSEAADFIPWGPDRIWTVTEDGVLFEDPNMTDAECANLYEGFVPSGVTNDEWQTPLPEAIRSHLQHLRDYLNASPGTITNTQTVHVVQDLIRAVHYLNTRLADE